MRLPLPPQLFPSVLLNAEDRRALFKLEDLVVDDAWLLRQELLEDRYGVVNKRQWKKIKQRKGVKVYKERTLSGVSCCDAEAAELQTLMTVGTVTGELNDVMYGIAGNSQDSMRIKSSYIQDQIVDGAVLATLIAPSVAAPFRSLRLKWAVQGPGKLMRPFVRLRDYVYLESTGILTTPAGEKIGYHLNHSVKLPGIRELEELDIVRAQSSQCFFYCQRDADAVDVFGTSLVHSLGKLKPVCGAQTIAQSLASVARLDHCAQMKKLTWMLKTTVRETSLYREDADNCGVCHRSTKYSLFRKKSCRSCLRRVCGQCRNSISLSSISSRSGRVVQHSMMICMHCLVKAHNQNALVLAAYETKEKPDEFARSTAQFDVTMSLSADQDDDKFSISDASECRSSVASSDSSSFWV